MFNYLCLNDVDFEELCRDIMERKLKTKLRTYARGKDGGIDLGEMQIPMRFFVQVKHYGRSSFSSLKSSLKKEVSKIKNKNPTEYYLCISKELTAGNIEEIYLMFQDYMSSSENIITLKELEIFLQEEKNEDIVRKHFKLWLHASGILSQMYNRNIFIDCEMLFANLDEEKDIYVQTRVFERCLKLLEKNRILMITGAPGVGKTVTSKMLLLKMADLDCKVRFSTNGDLSEIKRSLSIDPDQKEIILLDDCLGQHYFKMSDRIEDELISIINFIRMHPNKFLIMNSRVTILNEARSRSFEFEKMSDENKFQRYIINMDALDYKDRSRILYNHLFEKKLPREYLNELEKGDRYQNIVEHQNYTPRLVEYISRKNFYVKIKPEDYFNEVIEKFDYPDKIWEEEFNRRHTSLDRIFMFVLYSLTDTYVDGDLQKRAFEKRISLLTNLDTSLNHYDEIVERLYGSLISILDVKGQKMISVLNPSVNDYLRKKFFSNPFELEKIQQSIVHINQIERCYQNPNDQFSVVASIVESGEILRLSFNSQKEAYSTITLFVLELRLKKAKYKKIIQTLLLNCNIDRCESRFGLSSPYNLVVKNLIENQELFDYYEIDTMLSDHDKFENFLFKFDLDRIDELLSVLWPIMIKRKIITLGNIKDYEQIVRSTIEQNVEFWINDIELSKILDDSDLEDIVKNNADDIESEEVEYDTFSIENEVQDVVKNYLIDHLDSWLGDCNFIDGDTIDQLINDSKLIDISGDDIVDLVADDL